MLKTVFEILDQNLPLTHMWKSPRALFIPLPAIQLMLGLAIVLLLHPGITEEGKENENRKKKILFIAGAPSHAHGHHEHRAGCMLLTDALNESGLNVEAKTHWYGWPKDESIFDGVDVCIIYADKGGQLDSHLTFLDQKIKEGMGIMFIHYGVHPTKEIGEAYFSRWIGGFMETGWSVNPHWIAELTTNQNHPVSRGLEKPFQTLDEFYWNMRFPTEQECDCCHSLVTGTPTPDKVVKYANLWNKHGEAGFGDEQSLMWCRNPKTGGRGVGFVGGHYHHNWAIDEFRTLVLNAIVWLAREEIPEGGVPSKSVTLEMLNANLDKKPKMGQIPLPTQALLKQKPMEQPDLSKEWKVPKPKKTKKRKSTAQEPTPSEAADDASQPSDEWRSPHPAAYVDPSHFKLPEGLEATLWAHSPLLYNPTNMDIDAQGRIWVAEGVNYRRHAKRRPEGDRIVVIEDSDGDGKADRSHTFVQEKSLVAPLGVSVIGNQIIVAQPPDLIVYTDVDENLVFDPEIDRREVLLTGFNAINHDHSLHSVVAGPDGKWYINNGNCGAIFTDRSGKTFRMGGSYYNQGGGTWPIDHRKASGKPSDDGFVWTSGFSARMNPDGTEVEIIGHGYRNSYEHCTTSRGDLFQNDNDDPPGCRVSYVLEYGNAGYFTRDGRLDWKSERRAGQSPERAHWRQDDPGTFDSGHIYGVGSPTGIVFYENGALGQQWEGTLLSAEAGNRVIYGYQPEMKGAAYEMEQSDFFAVSKSSEESETVQFRPSDVAVGPDGALYIADWFDPRVGGHADLDQSCSGAIYRIAPKGFKPDIPSFDLSTSSGQITALSSPAIHVRNLGFKALKAGGEKSFDAVNQLLDHTNPWVAARGIWLLPYLGQKGIDRCRALLADDRPEKRITAYRAFLRSPHAAIALAAAHELAEDPSPAVRREVALSLRGKALDDPALNPLDLFTKLARNIYLADKNSLEAIGLGAENHEDAVWKAIKADQVTGNDPEKWTESFARITWRLWPTSAVPDLKKRASSLALTAEERAFAVESLSFINDRSAADALIELCHSDSPVRDIATSWIVKRALGTWRHMDLFPALKEANIPIPDGENLSLIVVPDSGAPSYSIKDVMALEGNAERGKATINRCTMCHQANEIGPLYGPVLDNWGKTQSREAIIEAIIAPSASIAHGYAGSSIKLKNGDSLHGLVISNQDPVSIMSTGGILQYVPRSKVRSVSRFKKKSLMLSADQLGLTAQDVADIVEYMKQ